MRSPRRLRVAPLSHLALAAVVFGSAGLLATTRLPAGDDDADADAPKLQWRRLPPRLIAVGAACFFSLLIEGAASDWSAKLVHDDLAGSAALGAIAYAVFSLAMGTGRLTADRLSRWGSAGLLRRGGTVAGRATRPG